MTTRPLGKRKAIVVACEARVGEQDIDGRAVLQYDLGLKSARRFDHAEAAVTEIFRNGDPGQHGIVHDKHCSYGIAGLC